MPKPISPSRRGSLQQKIKTRFIQGCGEQRIRYDVEELDVLARWGAEEALSALGRGALPPSLAAGPAAAASPGAVPPLPLGLSLHHVVLLELVAEGLLDKEISGRMGLTVGQVSRQLRRLFADLGVSSRAAAVRQGYELGVLGAAARAARGGAVRPSAASGASAGSPGASRASAASQGPSGAAQ